MQVDLFLNNATVYDVTRFDIFLDQEFDLVLVEPGSGYDWFSNNDEILEITENNTVRVKVKATALGESTLLVRSTEDDSVIKTLNVTVIESNIP